MNDLRKAAVEVLEALEDSPYMSNKDAYELLERAKTTLRQALEEKREPFEYWTAVEGWVKIDEVREHFDTVGCGTIYKSGCEGRSPLYTAPQKQWVGLTTDEAQEIFLREPHWEDFACAIEAKLKEKNKW